MYMGGWAFLCVLYACAMGKGKGKGKGLSAQSHGPWSIPLLLTGRGRSFNINPELACL